MEQVEDDPIFPPLPPEEDALKLIPEMRRRAHLQAALERSQPERTQTLKRLRHCQPDLSPTECLAALNAAMQMTEDLAQRFFSLRRKKVGDDFTCLDIALEATKSSNPGFLDSSYRQAHSDLQRGLF